MATIKQIFTDYGPKYIARFGDDMPENHLKVINAITNCRTDYYGATIYRCEDCGQSHVVYRSCGNRHCPNCQHHKSHWWLTKQMKLQLPGHHFMITFTVPEGLRRFIRSNQRVCYSAMFKASSLTLKKLAADAKYVGGDLPGFFGVLHTWGDKCHTTPTSIMLSPVVPFPRQTIAGTAHGSISSCRLRLCQRSFEPSSVMK